jgi:hypothetical protein
MCFHNVRIYDLFFLGGTQCLLLDYGNERIYLVEMDYSEGLFYIRDYVINDVVQMKRAKRWVMDAENPSKFALMHRETNSITVSCGEIVSID